MRPVKLTAAVAFGMVMALPPLGTLTTDPTVAVLGFGLILVLALLVGTMRWLRAPGPLVQLAQFVALITALVALALTWEPPLDESTTWVGRLLSLIGSGADHIATSQAPMDPHPGALWVLLALIGVLYVLADTLAVSLEQPAWTITPLITPFLIPAVSGIATVRWWQFASLAIGYLAILATESAVTAEPRAHVASDSTTGASTGGRYRLAASLGIPAIIAALVLTAIIPRPSAEWLQSFGGRPTLQLGDPSIDIASNLNRPDNTLVLTYQSNNDAGQYLRLTSLPVLDRSGARLSDVTVREGEIVPPPGRHTGQPVSLHVRVGGFASEYLPAPYAPISFEAPGEWGWEDRTLSVLALGADRSSATRQIEYLVTSQPNIPTVEQVRNAGVGNAPDRVSAAMPEGVPDSIKQIAAEVTEGATTAGEKALAIQDWLRSNEFVYSTAAPEGTGYAVMENFLTETKAGYCVHYATAMALLARVEGIPSRVAVGFLPGARQSDGWFWVGSHDMHAWPELFLGSLGWVAFEPTAGVAAAPQWTVGGTNSPTPTASPTATDSGEPTLAPTAAPTNQPTAAPTATPTDENSAARTAGAIALVLGILAAIAAVALAPWGIRMVQRARRLSDSAPPVERAAGAWDEVRATWLDLGEAWPDGTPRQVECALRAHVGDADDELSALALIVERSRYAKAPDDASSLAPLVAAVTAGMSSGRPRGTLVRAMLIPRSLLVLRATTLASPRH